MGFNRICQQLTIRTIRQKATLAEGVTRWLNTSKCSHCRSLTSSTSQELPEEQDEEMLSEENDSLEQQGEKPEGYLAWKPVDDVYMRMHYPPQLKSFHEAMEVLRGQDKWMFCRRANKHHDRTVTISVNLDLALQKKKKVDPFQNMLILPHTFQEDSRVLCFAKDTDEQAAIDAGADIVTSKEDVPKILSKDIKDFDYCVSTPDMMPEIITLKKLLRKRFPNTKRGSVGLDLATMVHRYKKGQEYKCQVKVPHVNVSIGKMSLTNEQIEENMMCILTDICQHKPLEFGPIINKLTLNAFLLDGIRLNFKKYLPKPVDDSSAKITEL